MGELLHHEGALGAIGAGVVAFFVVLFVALVLWVYRADRRSIYEGISQLPLNEDRKK